MATLNSLAQTVASQSQPETAEKRERMSIEGLTEMVGGLPTIRVHSVSFMPLSDLGGDTYSGLMNSLNHTFIGRNGEKVTGGVPVRFFQTDAIWLRDNFGIKPMSELLIQLKPTAEFRVYRNEDQSIKFLALSIKDITGGKRWEATLEAKDI